jgi:HIV Tat-specific factor 1
VWWDEDKFCSRTHLPCIMYVSKAESWNSVSIAPAASSSASSSSELQELNQNKMAPPELSFPTRVEDFGSDDRISFSKLDKKYIAVHDDGSEYEFDPATRRWIPTDDEDEHLLQDEPASSEQYFGQSSHQAKKRKEPPDAVAAAYNKSSRPPKKAKNPPAPKQNTAVYVTGLPPDATVEEIHALFSKKGGIIAEEIDSGRPRIKMYADAEGNFKGDALVVFFKPQSVDLAIMLLDETDFRVSATGGLGSGKMRVQAADSSYKKTTYDEDAASANGSSSTNGNALQGTVPPAKSDKDRVRDRHKIIKKTQKLEARLADWDDDEPVVAVPEQPQKKDKMVILKHMFTLQELDEDPAALLDIKQDIREECEKIGAVTNVVLYDLEPEGVVSVKFRSADAATKCVGVMNGRSFDGRVVEAYVSTGRERFMSSNKKGGESDEE